MQLHLDAGQANFAHTTCKVCGLVYAQGEERDEKVHAAFHSSVLQGIRFQGWQNERVIKLDGSKGRILLVHPTDSAAHLKKVKDISTFLEEQMGLVAGWLLSVPCKVFLYISAGKRMVGCVVTERISLAHPVIAWCTGAPDAPSPPTAPTAMPPVVGRPQRTLLTTDQGCPTKAICGVRLMWVSLEARGQGIASQLLDMARCNCLAGYIVPRHELAFSQPTSDGQAFAARYTGTKAFLVYT
ncbi:hypothetical protein WJX72_001367 [[Myrmecia] bisecta]|uniref:N-acetyltransferase ESCO2 n=1 Tax=[Myrmecia] bisecta TaxID=41462 RepID=A0AAW1PPA5_9CHLO